MTTKAEKYWINVASKNHVQRGVEGGFMQANHGKLAPLKWTKSGDWVIFYSPTVHLGEKDKCQCFVAIAQVADEPIYQVVLTDDFTPYRRNVRFHPSREVSILPLIDSLEFIPNKKSRGFPFRFGFLEINEHDFQLIATPLLSP